MSEADKVEHVKYSKEKGGLAWITLNRPDRRNAILGNHQEFATVSKVVDYLHASDDDKDVRVTVLTGAGKSFCAGADFKGPKSGEEVGQHPIGTRGIDYANPENVDDTRQFFYHGFTRKICEISNVRKPTIAMVNGTAAGVGMDLALHCDIRIGCENSHFMAYHGVAQIIENGGSYYLPKMVGLGRALEFAYTNELTADTAYQWGLLNHLVKSSEMRSFTRNLCQRIAKQPPLVQWISKRIMRAALDSSLETTMVMTSNAAGILQSSEDSKEAKRAFAAKREPVFKGK
ncbi:enoyl-CoA hydratase/isomerase family protein [Hoeflea poritis]|uniref:Enoyl-CoA hydratase-related protein n=1 Tax=Hoeflea poritis TaxID=2993659 RepID=A0ABT4VWY3_9HYPH|nr:enoyl-CoA hydratase-related protein [Hoeflea poritis]MDA4848513.1 enoyl-CoA hydratase-related protein [Hoeflea poritis]